MISFYNYYSRANISKDLSSVEGLGTIIGLAPKFKSFINIFPLFELDIWDLDGDYFNINALLNIHSP